MMEGIVHVHERDYGKQPGRPACPSGHVFIQKANEFKSSIWVEKEDDRRVNAKSLLGVLSLGIVKGTTINLIADGPDEEAAINALVELINSEFTE